MNENIKIADMNNVINEIMNSNFSAKLPLELANNLMYCLFTELIASIVCSFFSWVGTTIHMSINIWVLIIKSICCVVCLCIIGVITYIIYLGDGWRKYPLNTGSHRCLGNLFANTMYDIDSNMMSGNNSELMIGIVLNGDMNIEEEINKMKSSLLNKSTQSSVEEEKENSTEPKEPTEKKETKE